MPKFSLKKLNEIKSAKGLTFKEISALTGIPQSTVSKIFAGFNTNPSITAVQKIALALECGIDDFIEYDTEPKSPYYIDRQTAKIAKEIFENESLKLLFEKTKNLSNGDILALIDIADRINSNTPI